MRVPRLAAPARLLALWLAVLALAAPLVPWTHADPTDEVEWTAIAILHWQQLTRGGPPAGLEFEGQAERAAGVWRSGAQRTLFGFPSANLPKLVWGAALDLAGERRADAIVFDTFEHRDPARGARAARELERAVRVARGVTFAVFGLAGALLAWLACALLPGRAGRACGALALVLWLATPAVRESATFVRGDHFMVAGTLATLLGCLRAGERRDARTAAWLGLLCGLTVSAKLNGVFVVPVVALWWLVPRPRAALATAALLVAVACATFCALHPYLWDAPLTGLEAALGRWRWMRDFLREDWAVRARLVAPVGFAEGWSLFARRLCVLEDPWRALCTLPLRPLLLPAGLALAAAAAWRPGEAGARSGARLLVLAVVGVGLGTAAWLPIDWPRYWLPALALACLLEARLVVELVGRIARRRATRKPGAAQVP